MHYFVWTVRKEPTQLIINYVKFNLKCRCPAHHGHSITVRWLNLVQLYLVFDTDTIKRRYCKTLTKNHAIFELHNIQRTFQMSQPVCSDDWTAVLTVPAPHRQQNKQPANIRASTAAPFVSDPTSITEHSDACRPNSGGTTSHAERREEIVRNVRTRQLMFDEYFGMFDWSILWFRFMVVPK